MAEISFLEPRKVLDEIELRKNMIACDFGAGAGGWVIPLARRLRKGKVYAIDIQEEMLSALESKADSEEVFNIKTIVCDLENIKGLELKDNFTDLILMTNLLFQLENRKQVFKEGKRILKRGGQILVVDWKEGSPFGPREGRISAKEVKKIAMDAGLEIEKEFEAGDYHYGLVFTKP
jgi:ubiquinone/menaquinone biosynthesis C-methylase UbiE